MIYKNTTCKEVISRVYSAIRINEENRWVDMIEWIGEALAKINAFPQFEQKVCPLTISSYKAALPCDFHRLNVIYYNGYPMKPNPSLLGNSLVSINVNDEESTVDDITKNKLSSIPGFSSVSTTVNEFNQHTYTIDNCYLRTTFSSGTVYIAYQAFPTDEDGFPLIPENEMYKEALFWYILMLLSMSDWYEGKPSRYEECRDKWNFYCIGAKADGLMPDLPELEGIKNQWVRLLPNINKFSTFFTTLNKQENLNI